MSILSFSLETAQSLVGAGNQFPVNFDDAWQWLGYTRKDSAKDTLTKNFERGYDFTSLFSIDNRKTPQGGRPSESIALTVDCFKMLAMMAGTEQGRQVRLYFLECERLAKTTPPVVKNLPDIFTRFKKIHADLKPVPKGYFVIIQIVQTWLSTISEDYDWSTGEWSDLLDGSVGLCWVNYCRDSIPLAIETRCKVQYKLLDINCYENRFYGDFMLWFEDVYLPIKFPNYIKGKQKKGQLLPVNNEALYFRKPEQLIAS